MAITNDERRHMYDDEITEEVCWGGSVPPEEIIYINTAPKIRMKYVPEQTCRMELCDTGEWFRPECIEEYLMCDHCKFVGYYVQVNEDANYWCAMPKYCPECGRKVIN